MFIESLLYALIAFLAILLLEVFIYQAYLLNKQSTYAYLVDLKNKNSDILIQTKCSLLKRDKIRILKAKIVDREIEVIIDDNFSEDVMSIDKAYHDKKKDKYYISKKDKNYDTYEITPIEEIVYYKYKLKDRDFRFNKESDNLFVNKEQVLFKNPFTGEYYWEKEIDGRQCITEIDLMKQTPKKLDTYFFNYKEMEKILDYKNRTVFDVAGIFSIISALISIIVFILKLFAII